MSIYGNVDAALRFYRTYARHLIDEMGMTRSKVDACLFYLKDSKGQVQLISSCHVDDTLLVGTRESIDLFKELLKKRFKLKEMGTLKKHLGLIYDWEKMSKARQWLKLPCQI